MMIRKALAARIRGAENAHVRPMTRSSDIDSTCQTRTSSEGQDSPERSRNMAEPAVGGLLLLAKAAVSEATTCLLRRCRKDHGSVGPLEASEKGHTADASHVPRLKA